MLEVSRGQDSGDDVLRDAKAAKVVLPPALVDVADESTEDVTSVKRKQATSRGCTKFLSVLVYNRVSDGSDATEARSLTGRGRISFKNRREKNEAIEKLADDTMIIEHESLEESERSMHQERLTSEGVGKLVPLTLSVRRFPRAAAKT